MERIAIVGAGMAGLAAAWGLRRAGREVVVFEKSRGLSGRAATRRRNGKRYDHGANFFRTEDPEVANLVHRVLPTDDLVEIPGEVWTFGANGRPAPGDPVLNARPKYTYRQGISMLGKLMATAVEPELRREARVGRMVHGDGQWRLLDDQGDLLGEFSAVVMTPPAPQAAGLLEASQFLPELRESLCTALSEVRYEQQFTFIFGFAREWERGGPFHALVNLDRGHDVTWVSFENDKAGHVPDGESVLIVQMAAEWSSTHYEATRGDLVPEVVSRVREVLPAMPEPDWWDSQRWGFARPTGRPDRGVIRRGEEIGLHVAGDALSGRGRMPLAIKSGLETARRLTGE